MDATRFPATCDNKYESLQASFLGYNDLLFPREVFVIAFDVNFDALGIPVRDTHSMRECMEACYELAQPGETVLLSPCCASFDLFKNMEDRGEQFKELARNL